MSNNSKEKEEKAPKLEYKKKAPWYCYCCCCCPNLIFKFFFKGIKFIFYTFCICHVFTMILLLLVFGLKTFWGFDVLGRFNKDLSEKIDILKGTQPPPSPSN